MIIVKFAVYFQITAHFVVTFVAESLVVIILFQIRKDDIREHFCRQFLFRIVFSHQDIEQKLVNGTLVQVGENALLFHPAKAEPLFQFRVRENNNRGFKGILPDRRNFVDHLVGEIFKIQRKF